MARLIQGILWALLAVALSGASVVAQQPPEFRLGFKALADQVPQVVGIPLEEEHWGPNGDSLQQTSTGLMVWRKADNWTAFTDGARSWINGPQGVASRDNSVRFAWEAPAGDSGPSQTGLLSYTPQDPLMAAEQCAFDLINRSRQENGLPAAILDEGLTRVARSHAQDMARGGYFGHSSPDGSAPWDRARAGGLSFNWMAENIGWGLGFPSATDSVRSNHAEMMAEKPPQDSHRRIILDPRLRRAGIGVALAPDGKLLYVTDFAD